MAKTEGSYKELQARLDEVLNKLQSDELDADVAVELYQQGLQLIKTLNNRLDKAKNKLAVLKTGASDT